MLHYIAIFIVWFLCMLFSIVVEFILELYSWKPFFLLVGLLFCCLLLFCIILPPNVCLPEITKLCIKGLYAPLLLILDGLGAPVSSVCQTLNMTRDAENYGISSVTSPGRLIEPLKSF